MLPRAAAQEEEKGVGLGSKGKNFNIFQDIKQMLLRIGKGMVKEWEKKRLKKATDTQGTPFNTL